MLTVISYEVQELSNTKLFVVAKICNFVSNNEYICVFYFLEKTCVDELCSTSKVHQNESGIRPILQPVQ